MKVCFSLSYITIVACSIPDVVMKLFGFTSSSSEIIKSILTRNRFASTLLWGKYIKCTVLVLLSHEIAWNNWSPSYFTTFTFRLAKYYWNVILSDSSTSYWERLYSRWSEKFPPIFWISGDLLLVLAFCHDELAIQRDQVLSQRILP